MSVCLKKYSPIKLFKSGFVANVKLHVAYSFIKDL